MTPRIVVSDAASQVAILRTVFDATGEHQPDRPAEIPIVATSPAEVEMSTVETAPAACTPLRILVADDNHDAVESLALLLRMGGHDVHAVFDGEAAINSVKELMPHVALLDIGMPKANGYEVARQVREHVWGRQGYLVALTGWGQEADKRRAHEAGFDAHLVKPVPPEMLDRLLASIASSEKSTSD